jgi:hypothetical protein
VRAVVAKWAKLIMREIYTDSGRDPSLSISGSSQHTNSLKTLEDEFLVSKRLVLLVDLEPVDFKVYIKRSDFTDPKNPKVPWSSAQKAQKLTELACMQAFDVESKEVAALGLHIEWVSISPNELQIRPNDTDFTAGYVIVRFTPDAYEEGILKKYGLEPGKAKAEAQTQQDKLKLRTQTEQNAFREKIDKKFEKRTGRKPSKKTASDQRIWEIVQDDVLLKESRAPNNVATTAASQSGSQVSASDLPWVKEIEQYDDFLLLMLDDIAQTQVTVPLKFSGNLNPGNYKLNNANGKLTLSPSGTVPPLYEWLPPGVGLPAQVIYVVTPMKVLPTRVTASPMVSKVPVGTKLKFDVTTQTGSFYNSATGPNLKFKWKVLQDPAPANKKDKSQGFSGPPMMVGDPMYFEIEEKNVESKVIDGPTTGVLGITTSFIGRLFVTCEFTDANVTPPSTKMLGYLQVVAPEDDLLTVTHAATQAPKYDLFLIDLQWRYFELLNGGLQEQDALGVPYIENRGLNPAPVTIASQTYTVVPVPKATTFRWYVRCSNWKNLGSKYNYIYKQVDIDGQPAYDLGSTGKTATWVTSQADIYTIFCDQFDASRQKIGTAWYRQVVLADQEFKALSKFRKYMDWAAKGMGKILKGKEVGLQAVYLNREAGETSPLTLFVGTAAGNRAKVVLIDLTPGADQIEYSGATLEKALEDFKDGNAYPEGSIKLTVPPNKFGLKEITQTIETTGKSIYAHWSERAGWASLGLTAVGIIAALVPGGQPLAMVCFVSAGTIGATGGGLSLYDNLRKAEVNGITVALDVAGIAFNMIGAAQQIRILKAGAAFSFAGKPGRFLYYSEAVTSAAEGLVISAEGINQISALLDNQGLASSEKLAAIVRVLITLTLQGALFVVSTSNPNTAQELAPNRGPEASSRTDKGGQAKPSSPEKRSNGSSKAPKGENTRSNAQGRSSDGSRKAPEGENTRSNAQDRSSNEASSSKKNVNNESSKSNNHQGATLGDQKSAGRPLVYRDEPLSEAELSNVPLENTLPLGRQQAIQRYINYRRNYLDWIESQKHYGKLTAQAVVYALRKGTFQLHHLIPNELSDHPLIREAYKRIKGYSLDRGSNIRHMSSTPETRDAMKPVHVPDNYVRTQSMCGRKYSIKR